MSAIDDNEFGPVGLVGENNTSANITPITDKMDLIIEKLEELNKSFVNAGIKVKEVSPIVEPKKETIEEPVTDESIKAIISKLTTPAITETFEEPKAEESTSTFVEQPEEEKSILETINENTTKEPESIEEKPDFTIEDELYSDVPVKEQLAEVIGLPPELENKVVEPKAPVVNDVQSEEPENFRNIEPAHLPDLEETNIEVSAPVMPEIAPTESAEKSNVVPISELLEGVEKTVPASAPVEIPPVAPASAPYEVPPVAPATAPAEPKPSFDEQPTESIDLSALKPDVVTPPLTSTVDTSIPQVNSIPATVTPMESVVENVETSNVVTPPLSVEAEAPIVDKKFDDVTANYVGMDKVNADGSQRSTLVDSNEKLGLEQSEKTLVMSAAA